jgi:hypothetical protein
MLSPMKEGERTERWKGRKTKEMKEGGGGGGGRERERRQGGKESDRMVGSKVAKTMKV